MENNIENNKISQNEGVEYSNNELLAKISQCNCWDDFESILISAHLNIMGGFEGFRGDELYSGDFNEEVYKNKVNIFFEKCCSAQISKVDFANFSIYLYEFLEIELFTICPFFEFVTRKPTFKFKPGSYFEWEKFKWKAILAANSNTSSKVLQFMISYGVEAVAKPAKISLKIHQNALLETVAKLNCIDVSSIYQEDLYFKRIAESCELASRLLIPNNNSREITRTREFPQESIHTILNPNYVNSISYIDTQIQQRVEGLDVIKKLYFNKSKLRSANNLLESFSILNHEIELSELVKCLGGESFRSCIKVYNTKNISNGKLSFDDLSRLNMRINNLEILKVMEQVLFKIRDQHKAVLDGLLKEPTPTTEQILLAQAQITELNILKAPEELEQKWFDDMLSCIGKDVQGHIKKETKVEFLAKLEMLNLEKNNGKELGKRFESLLAGNKKLIILLNKNLGPTNERITPNRKIREFVRELDLRHKNGYISETDYLECCLELCKKLKSKYQDLLISTEAIIEKYQNISKNFDLDSHHTKLLLEIELDKIDELLSLKFA